MTRTATYDIRDDRFGRSIKLDEPVERRWTGGRWTGGRWTYVCYERTELL